MQCKSASNLFDLATADVFDLPCNSRKLPRVMTVPGIITDYESREESGQGQIILVSNFLPLNCQRDPDTGRWCFTRDDDSLLLQMRDGIPTETGVTYVGCLKEYIHADEQEEVARDIYQKFSCVPTFLEPKVHKRFYLGFCKQLLWPLFHYLLPVSPDLHKRYDRALFQAYVAANVEFARKIMSIMRSDDDYVWVNDYHLMLVPTFLRKMMNRVKLGFFLHSPFPSSEIYRTLPVRNEILRGLLNADLIGFHTFDYARHFLSCCSRLFGVDYELKRGYIRLDYHGRKVMVKILPVGVHMGRLQAVLRSPSTVARVKQIEEQFRGRRLILGVDDMDIFKGISQKLLGLELLLSDRPDLRGEVVLVQIANPPWGAAGGKAREEIASLVERVNGRFGGEGYLPVVLLEGGLTFFEKAAYFAVAECCIVNAVRDGMNLVPYEYTVCRQGVTEITGAPAAAAQTSTLIVSEFVGCSPSLSGAIRVNPWNVEEVSDAMATALSLPSPEKELRHEKHHRYVSSHDVAYWARSFAQDLDRACREHYKQRCCSVGFGLNSRVVALPLTFKRLSPDQVVGAYRRTRRRAIFLDYDGTMVPHSSITRAPSPELLAILNSLCADPANVVFVVSGRARQPLGDWFSPCDSLGIAAEHGYFLRWSESSAWESDEVFAGGFEWKDIAEPVMRSYEEATDGSHIETKETALVWHHEDADPDFGAWQAKELLIHLDKVLANEPVAVSRGHHIVEVKPQGVHKGLVVQKVLAALAGRGSPPEFVMCVGDDRSDEDMFDSMEAAISGGSLAGEVKTFGCTVGQKPSKAKYYLEETSGVVSLLRGLAAATVPKSEPLATAGEVSFERAPRPCYG
ncbi:unnamed protein product [Spirodela intermedia]|uniref:Uncharacterized protein n=1 Tax=Spirodela intermedia TaxID=51605 RepID=A0A7I8KJL0_SPIIN|nr:unnamed protein product [Spirodela intermedia]